MNLKNNIFKNVVSRLIIHFFVSPKYTVYCNHDTNHIANEQDNGSIKARDITFANTLSKKYTMMVQIFYANLADITMIHWPSFLIDIKLDVAFFTMIVSFIRISLTPIHFAIIILLSLELFKFMNKTVCQGGSIIYHMCVIIVYLLRYSRLTKDTVKKKAEVYDNRKGANAEDYLV